jgi:hypothetical protein
MDVLYIVAMFQCFCIMQAVVFFQNTVKLQTRLKQGRHILEIINYQTIWFLSVCATDECCAVTFCCMIQNDCRRRPQMIINDAIICQ